MKKLTNISKQIQNNTFSYTGKGSFEAVANKNKNLIIEWLEDLVPLQQQIQNLLDLEGLEIQKRNYIRILTKMVPDEYHEFVSVNILVRDATTIAEVYNTDYNLENAYNTLINKRYLKYPGRYEKFVEFEYFQKFVILYREDLLVSLNEDAQTQQNSHQEILNTLEPEPITQDAIEELAEEKDQTKQDIEAEQTPKKQETNWTNLLLGKLR